VNLKIRSKSQYGEYINRVNKGEKEQEEQEQEELNRQFFTSHRFINQGRQ